VAVTHKDIHEARIIRDAEAALSAAHRTQRSLAGEEPRGD
jgi:cellobiose-specific phosphotransferase system component IIA